MTDCPYCGQTSPPGPPWSPTEGQRLAYDPLKGRLWTVCPQCFRWTLTPMESRWETLEACEEAVRAEGVVRATSDHLSLVSVADGELIRVGDSPRPEFAEWRYGGRARQGTARKGFWARLLTVLPAPPVGGYDPYRGFEGALRSEPWLASPFLDRASLLTYLFSAVPLAADCPSCARPLVLEPWEFQDVMILLDRDRPAVGTTCGLCRTEVLVPLREARATLRLGLSLVTAPNDLEASARGLAEEIDRIGGERKFLGRLARGGASLGRLDRSERTGLIISLDDLAEMEALEAEWRAAEEMAAIMDGELTEVPGFDEFLDAIGMDGDPER